ncbi:putative actin-related protein RO7 [Aspergillus affinis]|uniref:putative actin-related protein RO7 n=1 Tax=Aspergillus affinis TaxID=1070780 RepID=UPI0022FE0AB0|nr:actin-like ATPase domain-containing protein [Aspergillus affinis]KAI9036300.1 actin-like ATPase domain-containing protein [Aspergillus affinis]
MTSTFTTPNFDDQRPNPHARSSMSFRHSQSGRPSTPSHQLRSNNSSFASTSSASSSFRGEEDAIVFEFGARWLRAGFEGDSAPVCVVGCGPEDCRRAGDYRGWVKGNQAEGSRPQGIPADEWTGRYELWKMDLRAVDLGLVEDKIERMFRETYNKYLLTDAGTSRLVLVLPSVMPHPLLSSVLSTLFGRWRFPSITLLQSPVMTTTAAGVRSALVVDLGWGETVVNGVYEYREITTRRSTRAMKALLQETGRSMSRLSSAGGASDEISVDFEYCEELVSRFAWCKPRVAKTLNHEDGTTPIEQKTVSIPSPSNPSADYIDVPFGKFAEPVEKILFAEDAADCDLDDEEKPVPVLVYNALLDLPPDARGTCMSRIVFVGGGSHIPGIRRRVLDEVAFLVDRYGWSPVRGKVIEQQREKLQNLQLNHPPLSPTRTETPSQENPTSHENPDEEVEDEEEIDHIEQKIRRNNKDKDTKPQIHGVLREVESLGPWAGASLVSSLKVRGLVEIEREKYLQQGLSGASRDLESHGHVADRRSGLRSGGDRSSWTLAGWG